MTEQPILNLDDDRALDPASVGAKAATLAGARKAGLPVLPGFALTVGTGNAVLALAEAELADGNSGRARLAITGYAFPAELVDQLVAAGTELGHRLVVRSSSPIEGEALWAGAFASYAGIAPEEIPVGVSGCWASWFTVDAVRRAARAGIQPAEIGMAVLVQPEIIPEFGGVARAGESGDVEVTGIEGPPVSIVSGWEQGHTAMVSVDGVISGAGARDRIGAGVILAAADLARRCSHLLQKDLIEWAWSDGAIWLLQAQRAAPRLPAAVPPSVASDERLRPVVRLVADHPGPVGDAFVVPWALGLSPDLLIGDMVEGGELGEMLSRARQLATGLTAARWPAPAAYRQARLALQEPDPGPGLAVLESLAPPDREKAAEALALLGSIAGELSRRGRLPAPEWIWHLRDDELSAMVEAGVPRDPSRRFPLGPWEPFLFSAIRALSPPMAVDGVVPGTGAGRLRLVRSARDAETVEPRSIIASVYPLNNLAPLLFDAAGLMTIGGSGGAHVFEVAASLGVPSVGGVDLETATGLSLAEIRARPDIVAAIDGANGEVAILALESRR